MQKSALDLKGLYVCECCPKKPNKFETTEELGQVILLSRSSHFISLPVSPSLVKKPYPFIETETNYDLLQ
jgi:hypothetical protein